MLNVNDEQDWINQYYNRMNIDCHKTAMKAFCSHSEVPEPSSQMFTKSLDQHKYFLFLFEM